MVSNAALCPEKHRLCVTPVIRIHVFTDTFTPGSAGGDTINSSQRPVSLSEEYVCRTSPPLNWGKVGEKGVRMASAILCGLGYSSKTQSRQFPPSGAFTAWSLYNPEQHSHPNGHPLLQSPDLCHLPKCWGGVPEPFLGAVYSYSFNTLVKYPRQ